MFDENSESANLHSTRFESKLDKGHYINVTGSASDGGDSHYPYAKKDDRD